MKRFPEIGGNEHLRAMSDVSKVYTHITAIRPDRAPTADLEVQDLQASSRMESWCTTRDGVRIWESCASTTRTFWSSLLARTERPKLRTSTSQWPSQTSSWSPSWQEDRTTS